MDYSKPGIINFPKIEDPRGSLSFIEEKTHIPFDIERVSWICDVPGGQVYGGHAFKEQQELIIALSGSFKVEVDAGAKKMSFLLNRSYYGLYIPNGCWRQLIDFSTNSFAMILSSIYLGESDCIWDYNEFLLYCRNDGKR